MVCGIPSVDYQFARAVVDVNGFAVDGDVNHFVAFLFDFHFVWFLSRAPVGATG